MSLMNTVRENSITKGEFKLIIASGLTFWKIREIGETHGSGI